MLQSEYSVSGPVVPHHVHAGGLSQQGNAVLQWREGPGYPHDGSQGTAFSMVGWDRRCWIQWTGR